MVVVVKMMIERPKECSVVVFGPTERNDEEIDRLWSTGVVSG